MASPADADRQLVAFTLHGELYALPLTAVREIIRYTPPTATAVARGAVRGLINLRGRVLPVADLADRLGRPVEATRASRILVLELAGGSLGLVVDTVEGVMTVAADRISALPAVGAGNPLGDEVAAVGDRLMLLIDPERALGDVLGRPAPTRRPRAATTPGTTTKAPRTTTKVPRTTTKVPRTTTEVPRTTSEAPRAPKRPE